MQKHVSWVVALVVGIVVGVVADRMAGGGGTAARRPPEQAAAQAPRPQRMQEDPKAVYRVAVDDSPAKGPADALVTVVESSDFECPFCKRALPTLKQIEETYKGKVRFVFKHNPLPFHPKALPAAIAAEEARAQGGPEKFWAMHDKLFELSPAIDRPGLEKAAQEVGLDVAGVRRALDQARHEPRIRRDQTLVNGVGATGTPTFFINGRKVAGAVPFEVFRPIIDEELAKAEALVRAGTPAQGVYAKIMESAATSPVMIQGAAAAPAAPPPPPPPSVGKVELRPDDPVRGPRTAKVTVVEFSDFQCPFCSRVVPTLEQLEKAYPKDLRLAWKHQPLSFHPNAMPAAEAAEAAREQGKFWQMHDLMFANQVELSPAKYEEWARKVGLDTGKFKASIESHRNKARIEQDSQLGNSVGANGTPTLFVNCRQIVGAQPYERFKQLVDEELRKADDLVKKGVKVDAQFYGRICDENLKAAGTVAVAPAPGALGQPSAPTQVPLRPDDPLKGNPRAPVTLVVFSDFQCPFCSRAIPTLRQIEQTYGEKVKLVWKHQPLPMHTNAIPAAEAAEAAREQGKFWQMHDKLFESQTSLTPETFEQRAREIGLDLGRFRESLQSHRNRHRIDEDMALAGRVGATGTPTFFVNGEKVVGAQPFEAFKSVIDRQLQKTAQR
jgi:protein-disulfide isomerase